MQTSDHRDHRILDHVYRYRLATRDHLHHCYFPTAAPQATAKVVRRLCQAQLLREHRLTNGFTYLTLAVRGARQFHLPLSRQRPFTEQSLPAVVGQASFLVRRGLIPLTPTEFRRDFPGLCPPQVVKSGYFLYPHEGRIRLAMALVDRANKVRHLFRKLDRLLRSRYRTPDFLALIQERRFCVTILTGWPMKQDYLTAALRQQSYGPVIVEAHVVPELQRFYLRI